MAPNNDDVQLFREVDFALRRLRIVRSRRSRRGTEGMAEMADLIRAGSRPRAGAPEAARRPTAILH